MRVTDICWKLHPTNGITETTIEGATRGDSLNKELFVVKSEAHAADAARCTQEAINAEREGAMWRARAAEADRLSREP